MHKEKAARPETNSTRASETHQTEDFLPLCCVCGLVRDNRTSHPNHQSWITLTSYRHSHKMPTADLAFTHTYCPACFLQATTKIQQFFHARREQGQK
jgi:hypothetical protein